jgi:hypothetical protein
MSIKDSELILNSDGSVYHLHLKPKDLASTVITVGDPDRVDQVSAHFDTIDFKLSFVLSKINGIKVGRNLIHAVWITHCDDRGC